MRRTGTWAAIGVIVVVTGCETQPGSDAKTETAELRTEALEAPVAPRAIEVFYENDYPDGTSATRNL